MDESRDPRTMRERMEAGDPYIADDPELGEAHRRAVRLADALYRASVDHPESVHAILEDLLGSVGKDSVVTPPLFVDYGRNIHLGQRVFINYNLTALDVAEIHIGDDCQIGPGVQLLTPTHPLDPQQRRDKWEAAQPITLGNNVWLGGGVIVGPGVSIGNDTVVGAGAVVIKDLPTGVVAVGSPARVVKTLGG